MKKVASEDPKLSTEERNLLSVAYKNAIGPHRTAWRALTSIEAKEESKGSKQLPLIKEYKSKIEKDLDKFCYDILDVLDKFLISQNDDQESKVFYLKMKGDYHRYIAEYATGDHHSKASDSALSAFDEAIADIEQLDDDVYKDATTIMQLIRDNLTLWTSELEQDDEGKD